MKIMFCFPPLESSLGIPTLTQNRQFQYFKDPFLAYPIIPACLATDLQREGHEVEWYDCIAENLEWDAASIHIQLTRPDRIYMETKAPIHAEIVNFKKWIEKMLPKTEVILFGDHIFSLGENKIDFDKIGWEIDRELTKWRLYAYKNGNFKRTPGTYIMSARDCWWGKCTFCSWTQMFPKYKVRPVEEVLDEIQRLADMGIKEIMDDSGTFPVGSWLREFCLGMIGRKLYEKVEIDCNMRFGVLSPVDYELMRKAGFRMILYGLESMNNETIEHLNKGIKVWEVVDELKLATEYGLFPHLTVMFGFPWETRDDALKTVKAVKWMLKKGLAYSVQVSTCIPYPGTKLFEECKKKKWLGTEDLKYYDMQFPIMECAYNPREMKDKVYSVVFTPEFILRKILGIRDLADLKYLWRVAKKIINFKLTYIERVWSGREPR